MTFGNNVQVVSLALRITTVQLVSPNDVQIDFVSPTGGAAGDFHLQSSDSLSPTSWADDHTATITATPNGFRADTTRAGGLRFYRVRR